MTSYRLNVYVLLSIRTPIPLLSVHSKKNQLNRPINFWGLASNRQTHTEKTDRPSTKAVGPEKMVTPGHFDEKKILRLSRSRQIKTFCTTWKGFIDAIFWSIKLSFCVSISSPKPSNWMTIFFKSTQGYSVFRDL